MYNPKKEEEILAFWNKEQIFQKSLEQTRSGESFVFYDGPPFATGLPHFGHVLPSTLKDIIPRYQTMKGRYVPRVWGWDCHGLPIENLVEKKLGLKNKKDIETYGIEKFNKEARDSVLMYAGEWKKIIPRLGRWVDMDNDYRTMNPSYTESVWWSFKALYDAGHAYEGFKSIHVCPRDETTLSNFEVGQGYKDITDLTVTAKFELSDEPGTFVLAWTTTPWTLPGNAALAVNPEINYAEVEGEAPGNKYILAEARVKEVFKEKGKIIRTFPAKELIGKSYKPLFSYYSSLPDLKNKENGWKIYGADFVTTEDGTGVVHIAPAFGEDDLNLGNKEKLPFVQHVSLDGRFKDEVTDFAGQLVKERDTDEEKDAHQKADIEIIKYLAAHGTLFAKEKFVHSYPHCWRCGTPLLNYATSSWFIKATDFKDRLVEENNKVNWNPAHIGAGRFGKWLENVRDWGISRTRYWGAPLPIWQSDDKKETEVLGSLDDLKKKIRKNKYFALRHGEAEHNIKCVMSSLAETPHHLTEAGKASVKEVAAEVKTKKVDVIFCSPFVRTRETADIVIKETGFKGEIIYDERLSEERFGDFEGKPFADYIDFYKPYKGTLARIKMPLPNGESLIDIRKRVGEFMYETDKKYEGKNILIITHEGIAKMLSALSHGGSDDDIMHVWSRENTYIKTGKWIDIDFASLPHNESYELDFHRPYIDAIQWKSESDALMKRIPDVFDTWYDSGSVPFASKGSTAEPVPADFIAEGVDQTRGWFYSLLVLGVGLFNRAPYKNVVVNGLILAEDGRKMSKSLNNFPPLLPTVDKYGADALRYFIASSPAVKGEDVAFSEKSLDEVVKKHFNRLYNVISLYEMFKDKLAAKDLDAHAQSDNVLDVWAKALLNKTISTISYHLDHYEFDKATKPIGDFIEELSTWYIRRSRDRFKGDGEKERTFALSTTRFILIEFAKAMAPFLPFLAEDVYKKMNGTSQPQQSVHLEKWPEFKMDLEGNEQKILDSMAEVRKVVTLGLEQRSKAGIKVRQPLARFFIREDVADLSEEEGYLALIKDELNVKEIIFEASMTEAFSLDTEVTEELRKEGIARELIRSIQDIRKEKGLSPGDKIDIRISGRAEISHIAHEYKDMISKITSVENFFFEESQDEAFKTEIV